MAPLGVCEEARRGRRGVQARVTAKEVTCVYKVCLTMAVLLTLAAVHDLTWPRPASPRTLGSRGRPRTTPRPALPQLSETVAGWLSPALTVDLLTHSTRQTPVWRPREPRGFAAIRYVAR